MKSVGFEEGGDGFLYLDEDKVDEAHIKEAMRLTENNMDI